MRPGDLRVLGDQAAWAFVDQAAQDGSSADLLSIDLRHRRTGSVTFVARNALRYALVGSGKIVVLIFRENSTQVRFAEDQRPIQDFAAQRADEALADRVHPGCLDGADQNSGAEASAGGWLAGRPRRGSRGSSL
jgi:hypothetical protein